MAIDVEELSTQEAVRLLQHGNKVGSEIVLAVVSENRPAIEEIAIAHGLRQIGISDSQSERLARAKGVSGWAEIPEGTRYIMLAGDGSHNFRAGKEWYGMQLRFDADALQSAAGMTQKRALDRLRREHRDSGTERRA